MYAFFVWLLVMAFIILGNLLHLLVVLPGLRAANRDESFSFSPAKQLRQVHEYVALLDSRGERPWFYSFLLHIRKIVLVLFLLMIPLFYQTMPK